jgi:hypothetical protein
MSVVEKTIALLGGLNPADLQRLPPAQRRRFADMCRHLADMAEPRTYPAVPKAGVLFDLQSRGRDE